MSARTRTGWWWAVRWWTSCTNTATTHASSSVSRSASLFSRQRRTLECVLAAGLWLAAFLSPRPATADPQSLPPEHWAYGELEHFEARGWLHLPGSRPYTRTQLRR